MIPLPILRVLNPPPDYEYVWGARRPVGKKERERDIYRERMVISYFIQLYKLTFRCMVQATLGAQLMPADDALSYCGL